MKRREYAVLQFLIMQDAWATSFVLSTTLGVSSRSIKNYISKLNSDHPSLIESSQKGFFLKDKSRATNILSRWHSLTVPQTSEERIKYILRKLLLEKEQYNLDLLVDEMFISYATLSNDIQKIKVELSDFELTFKTKNGMALIEGSEFNKKRILGKLIYEDTQNSFLSINSLQKYVPNYDLSLVKGIVSLSLRENDYFMDDFSLLNLVLNINITMERKLIRKSLHEEESVDWKKLVNNNIQKIVEKMTMEIETRFSVKFVQSDIYNFALLVMTRAVSDSINDISPKQLENFVGEDVVDLVTLMQSRVKETFNITITNPDFTVRFSLHVKNLLARLEHSIELRNPQKNEIKNSYPFIYDVAVFLANVLTKETGYHLSEDEISYFALYLGVLIEERKAIKNDVNIVLIDPQYFLRAAGLAQVLSATFERTLHIMGIISSFDELETYSNYDLVITTLSSHIVPKTPFVQVSNYLNTKDILLVTQKIESVLKSRLKIRVESKLRLMFKEELFFINDELKNQNDVIEKLSDTLEFYGYVNTDFKEKLFEREKVSSSAYVNIAMPHPFEMCALNSSIAVSLHPNGIPWNGSRVFIVFLLAINVRDSLFFKDIFDFITEVVSEDSNFKNILEQNTFEHFISALVSYAK